MIMEDYHQNDMSDLKDSINEFKRSGEDRHDGSMVDLANILLRIIHNFEHHGRDYIVEKYWNK